MRDGARTRQQYTNHTHTHVETKENERDRVLRVRTVETGMCTQGYVRLQKQFSHNIHATLPRDSLGRAYEKRNVYDIIYT